MSDTDYLIDSFLYLTVFLIVAYENNEIKRNIGAIKLDNDEENIYTGNGAPD